MHLYVHSFIYVYFKQAYKKGRFTARWWCMPRATGHASYDIRQANYVTDMLYDKCLNKKLLFAWACRITFPEDLTLYASNSLSSCTLSSTTGFEAVATGWKQSTDDGLSQNDLGQHTDGRIFGRQPLKTHIEDTCWRHPLTTPVDPSPGPWVLGPDPIQTQVQTLPGPLGN